ncbi:MAG: hypothetical protein HY538_04670 [Deltaproteobacteria bacterium]|nr:hypothetical protein [Deltaproteobacteria bacterium]
MKAWQKIAFNFVSILCLCVSAWTESVFLPVPWVEDPETIITYRTRIIEPGQGERKSKWDRWEGYYGRKVIRRFEKEGEGLLYASEEAVLKDGTQIIAESTYRAGESLIPLTYSRKMYSPSGSEILQYDVAMADPATKLPSNTYGLPLSFALSGFAAAPQSSGKREFYFYIGEEQASRMYVERVGSEAVTVPAGTFQCYRFKMSVDLKSVMPIHGLVSMVASAFTDDFYFWFSKEPPYRFVKYQGTVGPPGAPSIVMEVVSIRKGISN